jgi:hypothetical protein
MENQEWIAKQIYLKNMYAIPFESLGSDIQHVITDVDHFPYTRFYRGVYNDTKPHIWQREAGYHRLENDRYKENLLYITKPHHSPTQIPCSTILPRKLSFRDHLSNKDYCVVSPP